MKNLIKDIKSFRKFIQLKKLPLNLMLFKLISLSLENVKPRDDYSKNKNELIKYQLQQLIELMETNKSIESESMKQNLINKVTEYIRHNSLNWNNKDNNICI